MTHPQTNPALLKVPQYVPGKPIEAVMAELGLTEVIKLASNESPIGPSPLAVRAAQATLQGAHRYPGTTERVVRQKIAASLAPGLNEHNILLGNGGTDVLRLITQAFVFDGGNTVMSRVAFPMYHALTTAFGGAPRRVEPLPDCRHDLDGIVAQIDEDTRLVFLCSPNNPTGHVIDQAEANRFMARIPGHVVVVFDESYFDFVTDPDYADSVAYSVAGRNVLTLRSFSKSAGLANLRIGYLIGPAPLTAYIRRTQLPFHVGDVPLAAAAASLDDSDYLARHRQVVWAGRAYLYEGLSGLGLQCLPSQANFVTIVDPPLPAHSLTEALMRKGFIVRAMSAFGLAEGVRVTTGTMAENERFIEAMRGVLGDSNIENRRPKESGQPAVSGEDV